MELDLSELPVVIMACRRTATSSHTTGPWPKYGPA